MQGCICGFLLPVDNLLARLLSVRYNGRMKRIFAFMFWVAFFFSAAFLALAIESIIHL